MHMGVLWRGTGHYCLSGLIISPLMAQPSIPVPEAK